MHQAKPFVKSAGGKTKSLPYLLPLLPEKIETYYEPFVGGGAVFFALAAEKRFKHAVLSDMNTRLVRTWRGVRDDVEGVIKELSDMALSHTEEQYYRAREFDVDNFATDKDVAVWFIYMNKTCFNGLYRVNKSGKFNVPMGSYKNPTICDAENLRAVSAVLQGIDIFLSDFTFVVPRAGPDDAVYCDPPYVPLSDTAEFTAYTAGGFGAEDQMRLRDAARALALKGVPVVLSNHDTPFVRSLYEGFEFQPIQVSRAINSDGDLRGEVTELAIYAAPVVGAA